jgi:hypothetical protein
MMKMVTTKKMTATTNEQRLLELPYAASKDFELVLETVTSPLMPTGYDTAYGLRNKITGVVELRGHSLALSVIVMQNQQQMFDKVMSGAMNGYAAEDGKTSFGIDPGTIL